MSKTILVPLDGSSSAEEQPSTREAGAEGVRGPWGAGALPAAVALAGALEARLLLVQPRSPRGHTSGDAASTCLARAAPAHESLQRSAARVHALDPFLHVRVCAPVGQWADAVLDEAALERTELIVADRRLPGALALSRRSAVPLLLLSGAVWPEAPLHVLVPLDGSATAEAILPVLVRLGARVPLRATVLHVVKPDHPSLTAAAYCQRVADWLGRHGVPAQVELRSGDPVEEIGRAALDLALQRGGLLALGLPEALPWRFGYTAERLLRAVPAPVLQLRSRRQEHVVPDELLVPIGERDHRADRRALAGSRL